LFAVSPVQWGAIYFVFKNVIDPPVLRGRQLSCQRGVVRGCSGGDMSGGTAAAFPGEHQPGRRGPRVAVELLFQPNIAQNSHCWAMCGERVCSSSRG